MSADSAAAGGATRVNMYPTIRVVLIGKTGKGKSSTGNRLLGRRNFQAGMSSRSITTKCSVESAVRFGINLHVVDTPGFFDTKANQDTFHQELARCVLLSTPGPHVFVVVLGTSPYTAEEHKTVQLIEEFFGKEIMRHVLVVFTKKDELDKNGISIDDFLQDGPETLQLLLHKVGRRYMAIDNESSIPENNNVDSNPENDVKRFIRMARDLIIQNNEQFYTDRIYREAEKMINKEIVRKRQYIEDEYCKKSQRIKDELMENENYTDRIFDQLTRDLRTERDRRLENMRSDIYVDILLGTVEGLSLIGQMASVIAKFFVAIPRRCTLL